MNELKEIIEIREVETEKKDVNRNAVANEFEV